MSFFTSGVFWFIEGVLFCVLLASFRAWTIERGVRMVSWKWTLVVLWILLAGSTIAFTGTSLGESEKSAAMIGGGVSGVISLVSGLILWRILGIGRRSD